MIAVIMPALRAGNAVSSSPRRSRRYSLRLVQITGRRAAADGQQRGGGRGRGSARPWPSTQASPSWCSPAQRRRRAGLVEAADGGTLFLDEVVNCRWKPRRACCACCKPHRGAAGQGSGRDGTRFVNIPHFLLPQYFPPVARKCKKLRSISCQCDNPKAAESARPQGSSDRCGGVPGISSPLIRS